MNSVHEIKTAKDSYDDILFSIGANDFVAEAEYTVKAMVDLDDYGYKDPDSYMEIEVEDVFLNKVSVKRFGENDLESVDCTEDMVRKIKPIVFELAKKREWTAGELFA